MEKNKTFLIAVIIGFLSGALVSELLRMVLPTGVVKDFLVKSVSFGFEPSTINLGLMTFTIGINFTFTIVSLLIIVGIVYYFKWWL